MKLDSSISIAENDSLILEMFQKTMIDNFGLVLGTDSGQEFLLGFWNTQSIEGLLDLIGNIVPTLLNLVCRTEIVVDVVEIDMGKIASPRRHRPFDKVFVGS